MTNRDAFRQGYTRAMYKIMDALHTALRTGWAPGEIEAMLLRMAREAETEAEAFEAAQE